MRSLGPAIKVGITFVVCISLGYWAFMMLAKGKCAGEEADLRPHAYFNDATGLVEKSRVQIAGINKGHLVSRELNVRPPRPALVRERRFAKITVALNKDVVLYSNAVALKRFASLLGEFYIEIDPGAKDWVDEQGKHHHDEVLKSGDEIRYVKEAATADRLMSQMGDVMPVLKDIATDIRVFTRGPLTTISKNINDGIAENRAALKSMMANLEGITGDVRKITRGANKDVEIIIDDIKQITGGVRQLVGKSDKEVKDTADKIKGSLDKLSSAIDKLDGALGNVQDITGDVKDGKGAVGKLLKDEEVARDVKGITSNVETITRDAGSFIKSLTGLQTFVGLRSEFNFQANTIKTYVSVEIRPRPDKYYLIELIDDPRGSRHVTQTITRSDDPSKPLLTRQEQVVVTDAFRFTFQFAKRISLATFRFGIKESTGGVGVDLHFFRDRVRVESDLFDFHANAWPRYKVVAAWEFWKRLYIIGGIDDALNARPMEGGSGGRDYILGAQVRFNDEDLKSLLLFGGSAIGAAGK